jgi:hypothetical protein
MEVEVGVGAGVCERRKGMLIEIGLRRMATVL